ncbi:MAG TPA: alpha/beta hydrolase domain-containing protein, partial [Kofleriaceae bacterium]|nr:alpha/beta hydrolase domain-containing protein [Kofleriaceae bacterium]
METRSRALRIVLAGLAILGIPRIADAGITRIEITQIESPALGGASFGEVGPYEKLIGRAFGEVDPRDPRNRDITDLALAPRNSRGMVEYQTGILILRPIDPSRGNRRLFYELTNRGVILSLRALNDSPNASTTNPTAADAGNGFLMRQGFTLLYSGWDSSAVGPFASSYPVAVQPGGSPIVGPAVEELIFDSLPPALQPTTATLSYPAQALDTTQATLTVRAHYGDPQTALPPTAWRFNDARTIQLLPEGTRFEPGRLYELLYQARDPVVSGLALAAVRDIPSFLHHAQADATGAPNPLAGRIDVVIGHGISQPARVLHDVVRLGFNRDEHGRQVFDGILSYIAGPSSGFFNYRFAQPFRTHRQHIGRWTPERVFPFANQLLFDPVTEQLGGRLVRCTLTHTCPKIFEINSSNEYWVKGGSLLHTDTLGHDLLFDPPGVRTYLFSSLPHSTAAGPAICEQNRNPVSPSSGLRALLVDLDAWISHGTQPPATRVP